MLYRFYDTIPPDTAKADMRSKDIKLAVGIIVKVDVKFPEGCRELAHASVWRGGHQVFPTNIGDDFHADGETVTFAEYEPVRRNENWYFRTWNEDDTYEHTVTLRVNVLPSVIAAPYTVLREMVMLLKRAFRI